MTTPPLEQPAAAPVTTASLGRKGWIIVSTLMLATVLANIASVCMFPQIVALSEEFGRPVNQVVWAMTAFHVIATGVGGVAAALGAIAGNRRMLLVTLGLLLVGSLMAALSTGLSLLIVGRVIQGASMAIQALAIGIIATYWRGDAMRRAMSMIVLAMSLGAVIAYLMSGFIWRTGGTWRTLFWILTVASALDLFLTFAFIKETRRTRGVRVDYMGCVGLVVWVVLLLLPLSQANSWGWGSARLLGMLLSGALALILWVAWELRCAAPLVDLRLLKRNGAGQGVIVWLAISIGLVTPAVVLPYLIQTPVASGFGFGRSLFVASLALAVPAAVMCITSALATPVMRRLGAKWAMFVGMLFGLCGFGLAFAHGSFWLTLLWAGAIAVPGGLTGSASFAMAAEAVEPEQGILVSTIYNTAAGTGSSVGSAIVGFMLTLRLVSVPVDGPNGGTQFFPADDTYTWSALIIGFMALAGVAAVLSIRTRRMRPGVRGSAPAPVESET